MPAHRLTTRPTTATPDRIAAAVLTVLSGTQVAAAAAEVGIPAAHLADAVEAYRAAGYRALEDRAAESGWYHVRVEFPDWKTAERTAAVILGPRLEVLQDRGLVEAWWFIRKYPCWRLRLRPINNAGLETLKAAVNAVLEDLTAAKVISRWWPTVYEPETAAFGGPTGIDIAHELFCAETAHVLRYLRRPTLPIGRREISMLVCGTLLSAADLDRFERGDVWNRIAELRPLPAAASTDRLQALADRLRPLVAAPIGSLDPSGPGAFAASWAAAARQAGHALAEASATGLLDRGIRHILTHLVIFHWNRMGLSATAQAILSRAARQAVLPGTDDEPRR
ncbi:hypothetical protein GCM10023259_020750 [Thermocatellispora tengchongensis]